MTGALKMKGPSALVKRQEAKSMAIPIDTARAAYMLDSLTIRSNEEFYDIISAFYLYLQRHVHSASDSLDMNTVRSDTPHIVTNPRALQQYVSRKLLICILTPFSRIKRGG